MGTFDKMATETITKTRGYKQDLPPKGGYEKITWKRIPARTMIPGAMILGFNVACCVYGNYKWHTHIKADYFRNYTEDRSAILALEPMLLAERDRAYLKRCRAHREWERQLMADVPGWEVGTWFGHSIYNDTDEWANMTKEEFYTFCHPKRGIAEIKQQQYQDIAIQAK